MFHSFDYRLLAEDPVMWLPVRRAFAAGFLASVGLPACSAADTGFIDIVTRDKPPPPPKPKDTCDADVQCPPMTPHCDTAPPAPCVECVGDANCTDPKKPACMPASAACVECTGDTDCAAPRPFCNLQTNKCVECNDDQNCPMGQACDPMQHCAP